ncbi:EF2563 family selenium-dependent molybdenum hydroxylase system protein [bacterium]|nr:EF2563 family selenium-dependent molybdenum hydroxylase system protein [bacterium]
MSTDSLVLLRGGGDLGTGVAHRLVRAGYRVVILESKAPRAVRRRVAFAEAVLEGVVTVEGVTARKVGANEVGANEVGAALAGARESNGAGGRTPWVPVVVDPDGACIDDLNPAVVVDARMAKRNLGTRRDDAPLTVALGPGFVAGRDVDLVIETKRGHSLGTVIETGAALPNTGVPGVVGGVAAGRLLRSPADGEFLSSRSIGDIVLEGDTLASVAGKPVVAAVGGIVRGLIADGLNVREGEKVGDVDPRGSEIDPGAISDKARAIGGAVLEALLSRGMLPAERI